MRAGTVTRVVSRKGRAPLRDGRGDYLEVQWDGSIRGCRWARTELVLEVGDRVVAEGEEPIRRAESHHQEVSVPERNDYPRVSALAESFPTLVGKPGVRPFDPNQLAKHYGVASSGERHAIALVLTVFNSAAMRGDGYEPVRTFDAEAALATWDPDHRNAFVAWASAPWWP